MNHNIQKSAFTLIELVIVVAIIGVLSAIAVPTFNSYIKDADRVRVEATADSIYKALLAFDVDNHLIIGENDVYNPTAADLAPYLDSKVKIVNWTEGTNQWGHRDPTEKNEASVHVLRAGSIYTSAGFTHSNPATRTTYVIEMLNENGDVERFIYY